MISAKLNSILIFLGVELSYTTLHAPHTKIVVYYDGAYLTHSGLIPNETILEFSPKQHGNIVDGFISVAEDERFYVESSLEYEATGTEVWYGSNACDNDNETCSTRKHGWIVNSKHGIAQDSSNGQFFFLDKSEEYQRDPEKQVVRVKVQCVAGNECSNQLASISYQIKSIRWNPVHFIELDDRMSTGYRSYTNAVISNNDDNSIMFSGLTVADTSLPKSCFVDDDTVLEEYDQWTDAQAIDECRFGDELSDNPTLCEWEVKYTDHILLKESVACLTSKMPTLHAEVSYLKTFHINQSQEKGFFTLNIAIFPASTIPPAPLYIYEHDDFLGYMQLETKHGVSYPLSNYEQGISYTKNCNQVASNDTHENWQVTFNIENKRYRVKTPIKITLEATKLVKAETWDESKLKITTVENSAIISGSIHRDSASEDWIMTFSVQK